MRTKQRIDALEGRLNWKNAAIAFAVIVLSNVAMAGYILPNIAARRPQALDDGFLIMIDLAPLRPADEVYKIFDLYTPDILGFVRMLYAVDFVMPLGFMFIVAVLISKMLRHLGVRAGGWRTFILLPFVALAFDYSENLLALFLISQYQDGQVFPALARVAGVATAFKFMCMIVAALALVVLLVRTVIRRFAAKPGA